MTPLQRDIRDGVKLVNDYWIRRYKKSDWYSRLVNYWTNLYPDNTEQGLSEGRSLEEIAETLVENAALSFQDRISKEYGISIEDVWRLVYEEIYKRKR